jgi:hypothetical protein
MKKELRQAISALMRHYTRLRMSHFHLIGIMLTAQQTGKMPDDWLIQLRSLRELPESRAVIEESEELLGRVLQTADEDALTALISEALKDDPLPN